MSVKKIVKKAINRLGYDIAPKKPNLLAAVENLPHVETIIDVGVGYGTNFLYKAFPEAYLLLVEPVESSAGYINDLLQKRPGKWIKAAAGKEAGQLTFLLNKSDIKKSSFFERTSLTKLNHDIEECVVDVTTLDDIVAAHAPQKPFGVKIDTEGYELEVLKGASETLKSAAFVITECSVKERFVGSYRFEELIGMMADYGFSVEYILSANSDQNGIVRMLDIAFVRKG